MVPHVSLGRVDSILTLTSNGFLPKKSPSFQIRSTSSSGTHSIVKHAKGISKSFDGGNRSLDKGKVLLNGSGVNLNLCQSFERTEETETHNNAPPRKSKRKTQ